MTVRPTPSAKVRHSRLTRPNKDQEDVLPSFKAKGLSQKASEDRSILTMAHGETPTDDDTEEDYNPKKLSANLTAALLATPSYKSCPKAPERSFLGLADNDTEEDDESIGQSLISASGR